MPSPLSRLTLAAKALRDLGPRPLAAYAWYQFRLQTGITRWETPAHSKVGSSNMAAFVLHPLLADLPDRSRLQPLLDEASFQHLLDEAAGLAAGRVRLFGGPPVPLSLEVPGPLMHWSAYRSAVEGMQPPGTPADIKWTWEPARFGWALTLARAYLLTGDEDYPALFWQYIEKFLQENPANLGPHWSSAQEVALRLIVLCLAWQVFYTSPHSSPDRSQLLARAVAEHAARIPPTLDYARAQNNNHLLAEAAGLYTAGLYLPEHPSSASWQELGWRWFNTGLQSQIAPDGSYIQNSTNYHRLMIQLGLWVNRLSIAVGQSLPSVSQVSLARATHWLLTLLDRDTGQVPNLGPNDGAYFLPLSSAPFQDYRPVLQAASQAFLGQPAFSPGVWDEMSLWLVPGNLLSPEPDSHPPQSPTLPVNTQVIHPASGASWAYLRVAKFNDRPGHADQLHLDLWWRGINLGRDSGSYLYNAPPPWDNNLAVTACHNTITVRGQDQMLRAGRFLWLDWAQGQVLSHERSADGSWERLAAYHDGYRRLGKGGGVIHRRDVETDGFTWNIEDLLLPAHPDKNDQPEVNRAAETSAAVHWLLPDWRWEWDPDDSTALRLDSPFGWVTLLFEIRCAGSLLSPPAFQIVRAGALASGDGEFPAYWGWYSPTYGYKEPALSVHLFVTGTLPLTLVTHVVLPSNGEVSHD